MAGFICRSQRSGLLRALVGRQGHFVSRWAPVSHLSLFQSPNDQQRYFCRPSPNWDVSRRFCAGPNKPQVPKETTPTEPEEKKLSLFQKFKQMYKEYWYVLLPVHVATSAVWVGIFYYAVSTGVDVVALLEKLHASEKILTFLRNNEHAGNVAAIYALYKVATPARYFVTVGGTTFAINKLKNLGYIKPIPNREQLKEMYQERRENFKESMQERKENFKENMQERKDNFIQKFKK
jgi:Protein of unknown function (DUF1279)